MRRASGRLPTVEGNYEEVVRRMEQIAKLAETYRLEIISDAVRATLTLLAWVLRVRSGRMSAVRRR
jgi:hypothetical protein